MRSDTERQDRCDFDRRARRRQAVRRHRHRERALLRRFDPSTDDLVLPVPSRIAGRQPAAPARHAVVQLL